MTTTTRRPLRSVVLVVGGFIVVAVGCRSGASGEDVSVEATSATVDAAPASTGGAMRISPSTSAPGGTSAPLVTAPPPDPVFDCLLGRWSIVEVAGNVDDLGRQLSGSVTGVELEFFPGGWSLEAVNGIVSPGIAGTQGDLELDGTASGDTQYTYSGDLVMIIGPEQLAATVARVPLLPPDVPFDDVVAALGTASLVHFVCDPTGLSLNGELGVTTLVRLDTVEPDMGDGMTEDTTSGTAVGRIGAREDYAAIVTQQAGRIDARVAECLGNALVNDTVYAAIKKAGLTTATFSSLRDLDLTEAQIEGIPADVAECGTLAEQMQGDEVREACFKQTYDNDQLGKLVTYLAFGLELEAEYQALNATVQDCISTATTPTS